MQPCHTCHSRACDPLLLPGCCVHRSRPPSCPRLRTSRSRCRLRSSPSRPCWGWVATASLLFMCSADSGLPSMARRCEGEENDWTGRLLVVYLTASPSCRCAVSPHTRSRRAASRRPSCSTHSAPRCIQICPIMHSFCPTTHSFCYAGQRAAAPRLLPRAGRGVAALRAPGAPPVSQGRLPVG